MAKIQGYLWTYLAKIQGNLNIFLKSEGIIKNAVLQKFCIFESITKNPKNETFDAVFISVLLTNFKFLSTKNC